jgi:hypothetical protein
MIYPKIVVLTILSGAAALHTAAQSERRRGPIIRQVDHVLVQSRDPAALFSFFTATLQLPEAWRPADNGEFVSAGVGAGNVNLGIYRYPEPAGAPPSKITRAKFLRARFAGLAFQPYPLADAMRELRICGIPHNAPEPRISTLPDGSEGVLWTTVSLPSFSRPGMTIFLYEYSPKFLRVEVQRQMLGNKLALNNGGSIGFQSVREIVIESTDIERDTAAWEMLLGKPTASGNRRMGSGPAIRLIAGASDCVHELIFNIKSLDRAKEFLEKNQLLGPCSSEPEGFFLNPSKIQGLKILLAEK